MQRTILISAVISSLAIPAHAQPAPAPVPEPKPAPPAAATMTLIQTAGEPAVVDEDGGKSKKKQTQNKTEHVLAIGGYMQVFFSGRIEANGDGKKDPTGFRVQRLRLEVKGKINKYVGYDVEIDPRAPVITDILRDAYLQVSNVIPRHRIRIGQQKTQFGYEEPESSSRLYVVNRAEVSGKLSHGINARDIGVGLLGNWPIGGGVTLEDAVTVVNGNGINTQLDDTHRKNVWGRVGAIYEAPSSQLVIHAGVSGAYGDQIEPENPGPPVIPSFLFKFKRYGADLEIDHPYGFLAAEYVVGSNTVATDPSLDSDSRGWYALLVGKTPWDAGPLVRYDKLEGYHRITFGGFWGAPRNNLRLLVNYEIYGDEIRGRDHRYYLWMQGRF